jgi:hypothetical protein
VLPHLDFLTPKLPVASYHKGSIEEFGTVRRPWLVPKGVTRICRAVAVVTTMTVVLLVPI